MSMPHAANQNLTLELKVELVGMALKLTITWKRDNLPRTTAVTPQWLRTNASPGYIGPLRSLRYNVLYNEPPLRASGRVPLTL